MFWFLGKGLDAYRQARQPRIDYGRTLGETLQGIRTGRSRLPFEALPKVPKRNKQGNGSSSPRTSKNVGSGLRFDSEKLPETLPGLACSSLLRTRIRDNEYYCLSRVWSMDHIHALDLVAFHQEPCFEVEMSVTKQIFQLSSEDWTRLQELSSRARSTPVILVGDVDLSRSAHDHVQQCWRELGFKYGFDSATVEPFNEAERKIKAHAILDQGKAQRRG